MDNCPRRRLGNELGRLRADRHHDRPVTRNRRSAFGSLRDRHPVEDAPRHSGRVRLKDRLHRAGDHRRPRAPCWGEDGGAVADGGLVQAQDAPARQALPEAVLGDTGHVEVAGRRDADARAVAVGRALDHPVLQHDPGRVPVVPVEEVAVHAGDRGRVGDRLLHRRDALPAGDRPKREHRLERIEADRPRPYQHVDHDRPVRRELDLARVDDPRHEDLCVVGTGRGRNRCGQAQDDRPDEDSAEHDPASR